MISDKTMLDLIKGLDEFLGGPEVFFSPEELEMYLSSAYGIAPEAADEMAQSALDSALSAMFPKRLSPD